MTNRPARESTEGRTRIARSRASTLSFALFALAVIFAALAMSDSLSQRWADISRIVAVAFFVTAMIALALGMIGDAYHQNKP